MFIAGRTLAKLDAVTADIAACCAGVTIETAQVDALDQRAVELHADAVAARAGSIDIAFNAVSVMHDQGTLLEDLSLDEFLRPIDGFLRTLFISSTAVARHMGGNRPGVILTMSEAGARFAVPGLLGHIVSSAGKETFARVLAAELAPRNIRVICIRSHALMDAPAAGSYTEKLFTPAAAAAGLSVEEWVAGLAESTMLKRLPTLADVAETAAFLASDRARVMTGTVANLPVAQSWIDHDIVRTCRRLAPDRRRALRLTHQWRLCRCKAAIRFNTERRRRARRWQASAQRSPCATAHTGVA